MANNGQEVRIRDDIYSEEEEHMGPNVGKGKNNEEVKEVDLEANNVAQGWNGSKKGSRDEYYQEGDLQVWNDKWLRRDEELKDTVSKLTDLYTVVNFMMQNNVMQLAFSLQDTPSPAAKASVEKDRQKTVLIVSQHAKGQRTSHQ